MTREITEDLSMSKKIAYALPAFALAVVGIPVYVYIPKFYADVVGIHITILGYLMFGVRLFDAVTDPAIGYVSDRTRTRFGRRAPYLAIGSVLVAVAMLLLFIPPGASVMFETIWFGVSIYLLFLFWTAVVVPFESLGPEITFDYHERTSLFGMRDGFLIAGTLAAASSPAAIQWLFNLPPDADGERAKFFWIAVIYAPLLIGTCWWCALSIREKQLNIAAQKMDIRTGLSILGMAGYTPNAEQPAAVLTTLRVLYALVPSICNVMAMAIAFAYPIRDRKSVV